MQKENDGYELNSPYDLDTMYRVMEVNKYKKRNTYIFYRNDTVLASNSLLFIAEKRNDLSYHTNKVKSYSDEITPVFSEWIERKILQDGKIKELEVDTTVGYYQWWLNYYPDVDRDVLNVGINKVK